MHNTAETTRGGRRKKSLLSTLKKSNSRGNLMDAGSDSDLAFYQQAREEAMSGGKTKPAPPRLTQSCSDLDYDDGSEGSDADLIFFQQAHKEANAENGGDFSQTSKAGDSATDAANGRGKGKMSLLVNTIKRSTSKNRMNDVCARSGSDLNQKEAPKDRLALPRLTRSSSTPNLMDNPDDQSDGSDDDLIFFQQAHEEANAEVNVEAKRDSKPRERKSLLSTLTRSSSSSKLMDGVGDEAADFIQKGKAGDGTADTVNGRGRGKMSLFVHTIKRSSTSKNRLNDGSGGSDVDLKHIEILEDIDRSITRQLENLEDIDHSITPATPHSEKEKRTKSRGLGGSSHSLKSLRKSRDLGTTSLHGTKSTRSSRISSKSPSRLSGASYHSRGTSPPNSRRERKIKSNVRQLRKSESDSRVSKREKKKFGKEKRNSVNHEEQPLSFEQLVQRKGRESLITPRLKKKKTELDLASPSEKKKSKRPGRSNSSNDSIMHDVSTISTKDMTASPGAEDRGYESDGRLGGKKELAKVSKKNAPVKEVVIHDSPNQHKRQSLTSELEDRESVATMHATMHLNKQIEELKKKVESLQSENTKIQDKLNEEVDQNGKMAMKLREHELGLAELDKVNETCEVLKKEHQSEKDALELLLKEKERNISILQQKINSIRVANNTMQMQRDSSRRKLTQTHGEDVEDLQKKIESKNAEIDDLTVKLFVVHEQRDKDQLYIKELHDELMETENKNKKLETELQKAKKEYEKAMKRKDETVDFLQESLTKLKLKESKQRDKQRKKDRSRGRRSVSPFSLKKSLSPGKKGSQSPGRRKLKKSPSCRRRLIIRTYLGSGDSKSTSNLNMPL